MLDTGVGIATRVLVCATYLYMGISHVGRRRQTVEDYAVSRNHAPVNVGVATLVASMFGTWVLLSPGETGANFGIISLAGYAIGMASIAVMYMMVGPRLSPADAQQPLSNRICKAPVWGPFPSSSYR